MQRYFVIIALVFTALIGCFKTSDFMAGIHRWLMQSHAHASGS